MSSPSVEQPQQDATAHGTNNTSETVKKEDADGKSTEHNATQSTKLQPADWQSIIDDDTGLLLYDLYRKPRTPVTNDSTTSIQIRNLNVELTCPICLGILRQTMTVMECLHRFCSECISKCLRLGKKECPACRVKCASRRHMRPDTTMDGIIAAMYPNLEEYEANEDSLLEQITQNIIHKGTLGSSIEQGKRRQAMAKSNSRNLPSVTTPKQQKKTPAKKRTKTDYSDEDEEESSPEPQPKRPAPPKPATPSGPVEEMTFAMMPHVAERVLPELRAKYLKTSVMITMRHLSKFLAKKFNVDPDSIKLCLQANSKVAFKDDVTLKQVFEGTFINTTPPVILFPPFLFLRPERINMNHSTLSTTRTKKEVTPEMVNEVKNCFSLFDKDGKGHLTKKETKFAIMALLGVKPIKSELNMLFPANENREPMHIQRFTQLMLQKLTMRDLEDDIRQVFISLDISCSGFITIQNLQRVAKDLALPIPQTTLLQIFRVIDSDGDGRVSFRDFETMMRNTLPKS